MPKMKRRLNTGIITDKQSQEFKKNGRRPNPNLNENQAKTIA